MKFFDYRTLFDGKPASLACLSTYNFDPDFFERRVLRSPALAQARRIVIFMDAGQWSQLLAQDVPARWLNRRYLVVPVRRSGGVFHPKLNLLIGDEELWLHCGSANLTRAGCSSNLELVNAIRVSIADADKHPELLNLMRAALRFFELASKDGHEEAARIGREWLKEIRDGYAWAGENQGEHSELSLVHTYDGPLWKQVERELGRNGPERVVVISPFYDADAKMFSRINSVWPGCRIEVVAQEGTTNLPVDVLKKLRLPLALNALGTVSRRLHAKLFVLQGRNQWVILAGSANFTAAALDGRNVEACLLLKQSSDPVEALFDGQFTKRRIKLDEFEPGDELAPEPVEDVPSQLRITEAVLLPDDRLRIKHEHRLAERPTTIAVALRCAGESRPRASLALSNRPSGVETLSLPKAAMAEAHGSLLVSMTAETQGGRLESAPVWVIQEPRLTHEPSEGRSADQRRIVEETGQGLAEYLDELGKTEGTAAVIEYLKHLNIRFQDGGGNGPGGLKPFHLQRHDPFHPDVRPEWMIPGIEASPDLKEAIYDFADRHEHYRLRRHAERGNINGLENFLDIFTAMVRLLYVYLRRGAVDKQQFIGRVCRYVEIATGGFEESEDGCPGYLDSLSANLQGDKSLLRKLCRETNFGGLIRAAFVAAQMVRYDPDEVAGYAAKPARPADCLPSDWKKMRGAFESAGVPLPITAEIESAIKQYRMLSDEEIESWMRALGGDGARGNPSEVSAKNEAALLNHHRMEQLLGVARFRLRRQSATQAQCVSWIQKELADVGVDWKAWLWMLSRYSHDPEVRDRVDHLTEVISGGG